MLTTIGSGSKFSAWNSAGASRTCAAAETSSGMFCPGPSSCEAEVIPSLSCVLKKKKETEHIKKKEKKE